MPHAQSPVSLPPGDIPISRNADTGRTTINARPPRFMTRYSSRSGSSARSNR